MVSAASRTIVTEGIDRSKTTNGIGLDRLIQNNFFVRIKSIVFDRKLPILTSKSRSLGEQPDPARELTTTRQIKNCQIGSLNGDK
jgi:hypothetical protein